MAAEHVVLSQYEERMKTVADVIQEHSKLGTRTAGELAVHVLHKLYPIPEKVR
jgi:uncharacterized protein DUF6307